MSKTQGVQPVPQHSESSGSVGLGGRRRSLLLVLSGSSILVIYNVSRQLHLKTEKFQEFTIQ